MAYKSLQHFIQTLEQSGELIRVRELVSPRLEITEIADRLVKSGGKALLFEHNGSDFPLLINAFASDRRICLALGVKNLEEVGLEISRVIKKFQGAKNGFFDQLRFLPLLGRLSSWMPEVSGRKGDCQERIMSPPDLTRLPALTCWPADGGPFITLPCVHTKDPETGMRNLGMYRMQVFGPQLSGMHWHLHKGSAAHYRKYKALKKRMPVTVTLGGDPVYTYAATAPLPENIDEYILAGFLRKKKVELVKCLTNDLEVPADVDFVIEGYVDPQEDLILEGPFGDHTGFYSLADYYPRFHVECISFRKHAVYPATIVGIPPQEDQWIGKATEKIFLTPMKMSVVPELLDIHMPTQGIFHNIVLVKISSHYPGQAVKVMNALWGAGQMMLNKIMIVTDAEISLNDYYALAEIISKQVDLQRDIHIIHGPVDVLDHSSDQFAYGSKMGIDATLKQELPQGAVVSVSPPEVDRESLMLRFPEITSIHDRLLLKGIPILFLFVKKNKWNHLRQLAREIMDMERMVKVKFVVFMDSNAENATDPVILWLAANNLDPMRDSFLIKGQSEGSDPVLFFDCTRKTLETDGFSRAWPNVIVMSDEVIRDVDKKWDSYEIGDFVPSPSLFYKSLIINDGANVL